MNSMTSAGPVANTVFIAAPHNAHSAIPGSTTQVTLYPHNHPQVNLSPENQLGLQTPASALPAQRIFKEGKTLGVSEKSHHRLGTTLLESGEREPLEIHKWKIQQVELELTQPCQTQALQILIGLLHFGLGSILGTIMLGKYEAPSFYGGYPYWGGISFIISGSLSVASEEQPNYPCLMRGGLGMNILSAIFSVVGICLFMADIFINQPDVYQGLEVVSFQIPGKATSGVLFVFSLLELCIASTCAHFGCQLVSYDTVVYQTVYVSNQVPNPEPVNSPPSYSSEMQHSK